MRSSLNNLKIGISGGACLLFAFSLLVLPLRWIAAALTAAIIHEVCHALAVYLCGGRLCSLTIGKGDAVMVAAPMTASKEFMCTLAGPAGSALMVLTMPWFPRIAFCSAVHCLYNLLPIYPLDGGRALRCATGKLSPNRQHALCRGVENICLILLFIGAIYLTVWKELGFVPLVLAFGMFLRAKSANSPCKEGELGLQ